ncbi:MAG: hypothetical protein ACRYGA_00205 [Janthinobacterium lividum]
MAENLARDHGIRREEADAFALCSHQRAAAARASGKFVEEVVPASLLQRRGDPVLVDREEGIRADRTLDRLAKLGPIQKCAPRRPAMPASRTMRRRPA